MSELWQQEARLLGGPTLAEVLMEMRDNQRDLFTKLAEMQESADKLMTGFPAQDVDGHRRYHESVIEWRELRNKMVREGMIKVGQAGMLAGAGILVGILWKAFKISVTQ